MTQARGKATQIYLGKQSNLQTVTAADGYQSTYAYSLNPQASQPFETDNILGGSNHNTRDATAPAPGLISGNASIEAPLCMNHIGHWLGLFFGDPVFVASGSSSSGYNERTYSSGSETLPHYTLPYLLKSGDPRQIVGLTGSSLGLNIGRQAGFGRANISGASRAFNRPSSLSLGTVPAAMALNRAPAYRGLFRVDDVAESALMSAQVTYDNGLDLVNLASDDAFIGDICPGDASFTAQITVRYNDRTYADFADDAFVSDGLFALELEWQDPASEHSLILSAPKCRVSPSSEPITGPGGIDVSYQIRAEQTSAAPMVQAILKNMIADGDYL